MKGDYALRRKAEVELNTLDRAELVTMAELIMRRRWLRGELAEWLASEMTVAEIETLLKGSENE